LPGIEEFATKLRYAWRKCRKNEPSTLVVLASVIGIGANSAIFMLLRFPIYIQSVWLQFTNNRHFPRLAFAGAVQNASLRSRSNICSSLARLLGRNVL
jgi:hypothetical protein